jgi:hypothetical protein
MTVEVIIFLRSSLSTTLLMDFWLALRNDRQPFNVLLLGAGNVIFGE